MLLPARAHAYSTVEPFPICSRRRARAASAVIGSAGPGESCLFFVGRGARCFLSKLAPRSLGGGCFSSRRSLLSTKGPAEGPFYLYFHEAGPQARPLIVLSFGPFSSFRALTY